LRGWKKVKDFNLVRGVTLKWAKGLGEMVVELRLQETGDAWVWGGGELLLEEFQVWLDKVVE
jgi:hypothetical protein